MPNRNILSDTSFCGNSGLVYARVEFTHTAGNLPEIRADTTELTSSSSSVNNFGIYITSDGAFADSGTGMRIVFIIKHYMIILNVLLQLLFFSSFSYLLSQVNKN